MKKSKMNRRSFLAALAATTGGAVLAACQSNPTAAPGGEGGSEVTSGGASGKKTKILLWNDNVPPDQAGTPDDQLWQKLAEKFRTDHPEIEVEYQPILSGTEVRKAFISANASGTAPDLFYTYPPSMNPYYDQGFLLQIDDFVNNWKQKDNVVDALWYDAVIDGHYYGIPADFYGMTLLWRKDLFAEVGLDRAPTTWDELIEFGIKLTKPEKPQFGFGLLGMAWASWYWENFVWQAGGEVTKRLDDGSVELSFTDEPGVVALQLYQDLKFKYKITQENVLQDFGENEKDFAAGRTAMWMSSNTSGNNYIKEGLSLEQFGMVALPAGPDGHRAAQIGGGYWTLNPASGDDKINAAWTYAVWRTDPETWKFLWQTQNEVGITPTPWMPVYKEGLDQTEFQDVPEEWVKASAETAEIAHTEYIFKDKLEPYFAAPVQEVLTDPNRDCKTALVEAAKKMAAEVEGTVLAASAS